MFRTTIWAQSAVHKNIPAKILPEHAKVLVELGANFFVMDPATAIAKALASYAGVVGGELTAKGDQRANFSAVVSTIC